MIKHLVLVLLLINVTIAQKTEDGAQKPGDNEKNTGDDAMKPKDSPNPKEWKTLKGAEPVVIARGGFSGLFPDSSEYAITSTMANSLPNVVMLCNLHLTKDGVGICQSDVTLGNATSIRTLHPGGEATHKVNSQDVAGWFAVDFTFDQLRDLTLYQTEYSRSNLFDGVMYSPTVEDVASKKPPQFWLNVQYNLFYDERNISVEMYLQKIMKPKNMSINYISSPEINFLKAMVGKVNKRRTKLIFTVLEPHVVEPTTNQTYAEILKNLAGIKAFASGILVPKNYIYPVNNKTNYLEPATTLVFDAHKEGLEVYASGFANDIFTSYNYSYEPTAEYLKFIDNSQFAVDGFLTDFPPTASSAIACLALNNLTKPVRGKPLIISHNGASGVYPGCTDLAYQQAIDDGADIIDCSVQMSKDGVAFCLDSPDLTGKTTAIKMFMSRSASAPEIQQQKGIFSFDLTWTEIKSLKPEMLSPFEKNGLPRNPAAKNQGKLVTLDEFLEFAKAKAVTGILINIENAAYLASKKGLGVVDAVAKALSNATFHKQTTQQVLIQSDDSSVLSKFANVPSYKRVLHLSKEISDATKETVEETKKHANAITVPRHSLITISESFFTKNYTKVLQKMHDANISVYVSTLRNEFIALAFDYNSDPLVEIAAYVVGVEVDGVITEFPATASKYMRSPCTDPNVPSQNIMVPPEPGRLLSLIPEQARPPATAPAPVLEVTDILDPPLPPVTKPDSSRPFGTVTAPAPTGHGVATNVTNVGLSLVAMLVLYLLSMGY